MASINSLSGNSSTSSIYGNANIISGLASGMDTEAMIENAVSGIQKKIASLQQDRTMMEWEQEAYRSIIDKMVNFANKYTSFSSSSNLLSEAFFRNALSVSTSGTYADKVSASGRTASNVQILGVKQLASTATYSVAGLAGTDNNGKILGGALELYDEQGNDKMTEVSAVTGSLTLKSGNSTAIIRLDDSDVYTTVDELAKGINDKLAGTDLEGKVSAKVDSEGLKFVLSDEMLKDGNNVVVVSSATGDLAEVLGIEADNTVNVHNKVFEVTNDKVFSKVSVLESLEGKMLAVTVDGVSKGIKLTKSDIDEVKAAAGEGTPKDAEKAMEKLQQLLQDKMTAAFGEGKVTVGRDGNSLSFEVDSNSGTLMTISGGKMLGLATDSETSYLNTGSKLKDLLGVENLSDLGLERVRDSSNKEGFGKYALNINGKDVGYFDDNSTLEEVITAINSNTESEVTVGFSKLTNEFFFTSKDTGKAARIAFDENVAANKNGLATVLFGNGQKHEIADGVMIYDKVAEARGADAIFSMSVNGKNFDGISRSSNSFEVDGMTINLSGTFGNFTQTTEIIEGNPVGKGDWKMGQNADGTPVEGWAEAAKADAVSFTAKTDSAKIVEVIKEMVKDYNELANEIKDAYSTMPLYDSKGKHYKPLTEDDEKDMSDSAVDRYNEKAKTGILFGDSTLSSLYNDIRTAINELGMTNIGINTAFEDGKTTLVVDEAKLKATLDSDPEKVTSVFTKSRENGASSDGFMVKLKNTLDLYAKTTGKKGILIELAGSPKSALSLLNNTYKSKMDKVDETIARWQDKLADKIDYYNRQYTRLEQMISQMNSQSSSLMGLMGY